MSSAVVSVLEFFKECTIVQPWKKVFRFIYFYEWVIFPCVHACLGAIWMLAALKGQKRAPESLQLELGILVSRHTRGCCRLSLVPLQSITCLTHRAISPHTITCFSLAVFFPKVSFHGSVSLSTMIYDTWLYLSRFLLRHEVFTAWCFTGFSEHSRLLGNVLCFAWCAGLCL